MKHPYRISTAHFAHETWLRKRQRQRMALIEAKDRAYKRQKGRCRYCLQWFPFSQITIEHKTPKVRGGKDDHGNINVACRPCNLAKGQMTHREFELAIFNPSMQHHRWKLYLDCMTIRIKREASKACARIERLTR